MKILEYFLKKTGIYTDRNGKIYPTRYTSKILCDIAVKQGHFEEIEMDVYKIVNKKPKKKNHTMTPVQRLADYIRIRFGFDQHLENMVTNLKEQERTNLKTAIMYALDEDGHTGDWKIKFAEDYCTKILGSTQETATQMTWEEILEWYSNDEYPPFGGPFTDALKLEEWLPKYFNPPILKK